jgi:hypothetical protein
MSIYRHVAILMILSGAAALFAQETRGKVQGDVRDPSGAVVAGATVTLVNDESGVRNVRPTNESGHYIFDFVIPGHYSVSVDSTGFRSFIQKNILVQASGDVTADAVLQVGNAADAVTVESAPVSVEFNTSTMAHTVDTQLANTLPVISRNPFLLVSLDPAVTVRSTTQQEPWHFWAGSQLDVGGNTYTKVEIILDGTASMTAAKSSYTPPMDAIQEVNLQQNGVDSEFGHSAGGTIVMSLKSGTNDYHGTAYYLGRNPALNAMADRITRTKNMTRQNTWGGTFGMPVKKNKLFNFVTYEGINLTQPLNSFVQTLPTAAERQGDFSKQLNTQGGLDTIYDPWTTATSGSTVTRTPFPGNIIPASRFDPTAARIMGILWQPNLPGEGVAGANNFKASIAEKYPYWNFMDRGDWNIRDNLKFFARYAQLRTTQTTSDPFGGSAARYAQGSTRNAVSTGGDLVWVLNPTTVFNVRGSYNAINDSFYNADVLYGDKGLATLWPNNPWYQSYSSTLPQVCFPYISVMQGSATTMSNQYYWLQTPQTYNISAKVSKELGRHYTKFGGEYRRENVDAATVYFMQFGFDPAMTANTYNAPNTALSGNGWASFLLGALDSSTSTAQAQTIPMQHPQVNFMGLFFQDDYRMTSRLTLQLGLRWEYSGPMTDPANRLSRYLDLTRAIPELSGSNTPAMPAAVTALRTAAPVYNGAWIFTDDKNRGSWNAPKNLFLPRVGVAYRLNDKTALRAGFARYAVPTSLTETLNMLGGVAYPGYDQTSIVSPAIQGVPQATLANPFPGGLTPAIGKGFGTYTNLGGTANWYKQDFHPALSDRINISVQRQLPARLVADVTYFMSLGKNIPYTYNVNMADPNIAYTNGNAVNAKVNNPFYNLLSSTVMPGQLRTQAQVSASALLTPYPQYGTLNQLLNGGVADHYKSLQMSLKRAYDSGLTLTTGYNYNRDVRQGFYDDIATYAKNLSWIPMNTSRHRLTGAMVYELPFGQGRHFMSQANRIVDGVLGGWGVSTIFTYNSGIPIRLGAAVVSGDPAISNPTRDRWFDTSKVSILPAFTKRTNPVQYDDLLGPRYVNFDASLAKQFRIRERARFELRFEGYNMQNALTPASPVTTITSANFGKSIAQATGFYGRQVQFSGKLMF